MTRVQLTTYVLLGAALAISVVTDLRSRKIKNVVTLPTLVACLALRAAAGGAGDFQDFGLLSGLLGMAIGGGFFAVVALLGGMGGGDVKLVAAVGAAVGFPAIIACLVGIGLAGGLEALVVLVWKRKLLGSLAGMLRRLLRLRPAEQGAAERIQLPYGVAIAAGTLWGMWWTLAPEGGAGVWQ